MWLWSRQHQGRLSRLRARALDCAMYFGTRLGGHVTGRVGPLSDAAVGAWFGWGVPAAFCTACVPWDLLSRSRGSIATMLLINGLVSVQCVLHCEDTREGTVSGRVVDSRWCDDVAAAALMRACGLEGLAHVTHVWDLWDCVLVFWCGIYPHHTTWLRNRYFPLRTTERTRGVGAAAYYYSMGIRDARDSGPESL